MTSWTGAQILRMKQLRRQGHTRAEIAAVLRRTPAAIKAQLGRMGITAPPQKPHVCKCWKCGKRA